MEFKEKFFFVFVLLFFVITTLPTNAHAEEPTLISSDTIEQKIYETWQKSQIEYEAGEYDKSVETLLSLFSGPNSEQLGATVSHLTVVNILNAVSDQADQHIAMEHISRILDSNPNANTALNLNFLMSVLINPYNTAQCLAYIDEWVKAYDMMNHDDADAELDYSEYFTHSAITLKQNEQTEKALELTNRALDLLERSSLHNDNIYYAYALKVALWREEMNYSEAIGTYMTDDRMLREAQEIIDNEVDDYFLSSYYVSSMIEAIYEMTGALQAGEMLIQMQGFEDAHEMMLDFYIPCYNRTRELMTMLDNDRLEWMEANNLRALISSCMMGYRIYEATGVDDPEFIKMFENYVYKSAAHVDPTLVEQLLGLVYHNDVAGATDVLKNAYYSNVETLKEILHTVSFAERDNLWSKYYNDLHGNIKMAVSANNNPEINELAYNSSLLIKGMLLQSELDFEKRIYSSKREGLVDKYHQWKLLPVSSPEAETLEREIRGILDNDFESEIFTTDWRDVAKSLKDAEYAIEFNVVTDGMEANYIALVLNNNMESPLLVNVCDIQDLIDANADDVIHLNHEKLSRDVWAKFKDVIPDGSTVFFSADLDFHHLPLENLPDFEYNDKMISDRWKPVRVSSTRMLTKREGATIPDMNFEIYGGLDYSADKESILNDYYNNSLKYREFSTAEFADRGSISTVSELPGSKKEVEFLKELLAQNQISSIAFTGIEGTEARFKAEGGSIGNILHFSTHGFTLNPDNSDSRIDKILNTENIMDANERALLSSGLMMAGVNEIITGRLNPRDCEDGLLTAKEISLTDLSNIDFVVLSACKTGVGTLSGEGVFGLQRGFKLAGVKSLMMSLWPVHDEATALLMNEFYKNYVKTHNKHQSLSAAQQAVKSVAGWEDPSYWAGFILLDAIN